MVCIAACLKGLFCTARFANTCHTLQLTAALRVALQKVMEGERAQRSEVQRKLREVEKALAHLRNPEWWGPATAALVRWGALRE